MKVIDLLNKIANGEKCKAKLSFKLGDVIINYYGYDNYYKTPEYKIEYIDKGCTTHDISFGTLIKSLNNEIEIIEEAKDIEKLELVSYEEFKTMTPAERYNVTAIEYDKINELIDIVKELKNEKENN